jgi:protein TonB
VLRDFAAGAGALLTCSMLLLGLVQGLGWSGSAPLRPRRIAPKTVIVFIRLDPSRTQAERLDVPRFSPQRPPPVALPPMPEIAVAAPRSVAPPLPPKAEGAASGSQSAASSAPLPPDYLSRLLAHLNEYKRYPFAARSHRAQGTVMLHFTMDRMGRVLSYDVSASSGSAELDDAALAMIRDAQPLPPVPASYPGTVLDFVLPVVFSLR